MKKISLIVLVGLFFVQNSAMAMDEEGDLIAYKIAVRRVGYLVNNIKVPSDLHKIRRAAKVALSLQTEDQKNNSRVPLGLYARFGTGTSRINFLALSRQAIDLIRNRASEREICSIIIAALIMATPTLTKRDFKVLQPALWK